MSCPGIDFTAARVDRSTLAQTTYASAAPRVEGGLTAGPAGGCACCAVGCYGGVPGASSAYTDQDDDMDIRLDASGDMTSLRASGRTPKSSTLMAPITFGDNKFSVGGGGAKGASVRAAPQWPCPC